MKLKYHYSERANEQILLAVQRWSLPTIKLCDPQVCHFIFISPARSKHFFPLFIRPLVRSSACPPRWLACRYSENRNIWLDLLNFEFLGVPSSWNIKYYTSKIPKTLGYHHIEVYQDPSTWAREKGVSKLTWTFGHPVLKTWCSWKWSIQLYYKVISITCHQLHW